MKHRRRTPEHARLVHRLFTNHRQHWTHTRFIHTTLMSFLLLLLSFVVNYYADTYATSHQSNAVSDIILDNIPTLGVDAIAIWGAIFLVGSIIVVLLLHPQWIPATIKSIALFIFIRAAFITLTHIAPSPRAAIDTTALFATVTISGSDLFFSGHTGLPFLMALIFWDTRGLRYLFLATSAFLGAIMLLGHLHYSIDVFASLFITYTIYHLAERFFAKDFQLFYGGIDQPT